MLEGSESWPETSCSPQAAHFSKEETHVDSFAGCKPNRNLHGIDRLDMLLRRGHATA